MENAVRFKKIGFAGRLKTMLKVDFRRMFRSRLFYIMVGICLVMPVLILVMTTMMDGSVSVNPQTGEETVIEGFDNTWQIIGSVSDGLFSQSGANGASAAEGMATMDMSIISMCNINMLYFVVAIHVCLFVSDDFRSGYAKNLFTVRAKKGDYVASKTIVCFIGGAFMILAFFAGTVIGGSVSGLPIDMVGFNIGELVMCLLSKIALLSVFVPIYLVMSVAAKQKAWLSILLSFMVGMFLFMMIPMMTPLNSTPLNLLMCLAGGAMFCFGLGTVSNKVLLKTALI